MPNAGHLGTFRPTAVDLFSGVGGMSLGFERAGFDVVLAVDQDPIHVKSYSRNFPSSRLLEGDIAKIQGHEILSLIGTDTEPDVVFGGPPCQGFSYGGRHVAEDPRNELLGQFARVVGEIQPKYFVMENVAGLTSARMVHHLDAFVETVESHGFQVVGPIRTLNAADFGVPQQRFRVFVMGQRRGLPAAFYPEPTSARLTVWDAIGDLPDIESFDYLTQSDVMFHSLDEDPSDYASGLRELSEHDRGNGRQELTIEGLSGCARTEHNQSSRDRFAATPPGTFEPISRFYRLSKDGLARTIRAGSDRTRGSFTAPRPIHPVHARCISVREAARIHGFPDWFRFHEAKWHGFRQIGNAVPPPLAGAVASSVFSVLNREVKQ